MAGSIGTTHSSPAQSTVLDRAQAHSRMLRFHWTRHVSRLSPTSQVTARVSLTQANAQNAWLWALAYLSEQLIFPWPTPLHIFQRPEQQVPACNSMLLFLRVTLLSHIGASYDIVFFSETTEELQNMMEEAGKVCK